MLRYLTIFTVLAAFAGNVAAQDDKEAIKKDLLEKIRKAIQKEHKKVLKEVEKTIDEELAKVKAPKADKAPAEFDKKLKELNREIKKLELKMAELVGQKRKVERFKEDHKLAKKARETEMDGQEAREIFDDALASHNEEDFKSSIPAFKKLFYASPKNPLGYTSAYNVACGYALSGDKNRALDWLEISIEFGFNNFDHMRTDTDLDSLRKDIRFKRIMADK